MPEVIRSIFRRSKSEDLLEKIYDFFLKETDKGYLHLCKYISYLEKIRHPGNWLPSFWDQKRCQVKKNDVKWSKTTQSVKRRRKMAKTSPKSKTNFA